MNNKFFKSFRICLIVIGILIVVFLLAKDFALCGQVEFVTNFKKFNPLVSILVPEERVIMSNNIIINEEPVYFDVYLPRDFDNVNLEFEFANQENKIIEVGREVDDFYDLKPLDNLLLNDLEWSSIRDGDMILFQRESKYDSISDFLNNPPEYEEISVYNYNLLNDFRIDGYEPSDEYLQIDYALMNSHQFFTYIKDEDLHFEFNLSDEFLDYVPEETFLKIYAYSNKEIVKLNAIDNQIIVEIKDLPEGVYKFDIVGGMGMIIDSIKTKQQYLSFINEVYLVDPATVITESKDPSFLAEVNEGVQTIKVNNKNVEVPNVWQWFKATEGEGFKIIKSNKGNVLIEGNGLFAFDKLQYFNPLVNYINNNTDLDNEGINYVIARYDLPLIKEGFKINNIDFEISNLPIDQNKIRFVISVPGLFGESQGIEIKNLNIRLERDSLFEVGISQNIKDYIKFYTYTK